MHSNRSVCAPDVSPALHKARVVWASLSERIVERVSVVLNNGLESIARRLDQWYCRYSWKLHFLRALKRPVPETKSVVEDVNIQSKLRVILLSSARFCNYRIRECILHRTSQITSRRQSSFSEHLLWNYFASARALQILSALRNCERNV